MRSTRSRSRSSAVPSLVGRPLALVGQPPALVGRLLAPVRRLLALVRLPLACLRRALAVLHAALALLGRARFLGVVVVAVFRGRDHAPSLSRALAHRVRVSR
jgi:hypothetical protein